MPAPTLGGRRLLLRLLAILKAFSLAFLIGCAADIDGVTLFNAGFYEDAHDLLVVDARQGNTEAQNCLAILYYLGLGVPKNVHLAAKWFERAARRGEAAAQLNLGMLYVNGLGVAKDHERAFGWLQAAEAGGNRRARNYLAALTDNLTPSQMARGRSTVRKRIEASRP